MNNKEAPNEMHILKERAKELNCLYQVDEILNNQRFSLAEMFEAIVQAIPSGWQFPEICEARIVYENNNYQTSKFYPSPYSEKSPIKVDGKVVGYLEVAYTEQVPQTEEGCFLEKERKLINTIVTIPAVPPYSSRTIAICTRLFFISLKTSAIFFNSKV
jgi:pyruvate,water dikinase